MREEKTSISAPVHAAVTPFEERRVKIVSIDPQFIVDVFNWWRNPPHWLALPVNDALPKDCVVVSVSVSWERRCIEAMVASKEFPPCADGDLPERIPGMMTEFRSISFPWCNNKLRSQECQT